MKRMNQCLGGALLAAASVLSFGARAGDHDERARPSEWWQWALSIPAAVNPLNDTGDKSCMVGQRGSTWFLAGTLFGGTLSRTCHIPAGTKLFFPVVNSINFDTPGICSQTASLSVAELRAASASFINAITQFNATIDSRPVRPIRRLRSEVFAVALPADNMFTAPCASLPPAPPMGVYSRAVDEGYYAEVDDLSVGTHVLHITASNGKDFDLGVTYTLIVEPPDRR